MEDLDDDDDEDMPWSDDYDFSAPFNGGNSNPEKIHRMENNENDLMPRTFQDLLQEAEQEKKKQPRKPIEETYRQPNNPWLSLMT